MGKYQSGRRSRQKGDPITGMLLLDKPDGISSNGALQIAKRLLDARKAGHTGSLDPIATGLLPLCFGDATKEVVWLVCDIYVFVIVLVQDLDTMKLLNLN